MSSLVYPIYLTCSKSHLQLSLLTCVFHERFSDFFETSHVISEHYPTEHYPAGYPTELLFQAGQLQQFYSILQQL